MKHYEYTGWLKPYLPEILAMFSCGLSPTAIWNVLAEQRGVSNIHGTDSMRLIHYIGIRYGVYKPGQRA